MSTGVHSSVTSVRSRLAALRANLEGGLVLLTTLPRLRHPVARLAVRRVASGVWPGLDRGRRERGPTASSPPSR